MGQVVCSFISGSQWRGRKQPLLKLVKGRHPALPFLKTFGTTRGSWDQNTISCNVIRLNAGFSSRKLCTVHNHTAIAVKQDNLQQQVISQTIFRHTHTHSHTCIDQINLLVFPPKKSISVHLYSVWHPECVTTLNCRLQILQSIVQLSTQYSRGRRIISTFYSRGKSGLWNLNK